MAPILVTGATGNIGRVVVARLLDGGLAVRAAARSADEVGKVFGDSVEAIGLDFTDDSTWAGAYDGVERAFLMRPPHLGKPRQQMIPSLEYAKRVGVKHMSLLSLQGAEKNKVVPHHALEEWLKKSGLAWTFVRASFFMQNLTTTHLTDVRDRDKIMVPAGKGATAFVDAVDVGAVAAAALIDPDRHHNHAWTPTGPEALTYEQIAVILSRVLGRRIRYARPGLVRYAAHARSKLGMNWGMVGVTAAIYTAARIGSAAGLTDDVLTVTGREPIPFAEFAEREKDLWRL